jgi:hypothetical protein
VAVDILASKMFVDKVTGRKKTLMPKALPPCHSGTYFHVAMLIQPLEAAGRSGGYYYHAGGGAKADQIISVVSESSVLRQGRSAHACWRLGIFQRAHQDQFSDLGKLTPNL